MISKYLNEYIKQLNNYKPSIDQIYYLIIKDTNNYTILDLSSELRSKIDSGITVEELEEIKGKAD